MKLTLDLTERQEIDLGTALTLAAEDSRSFADRLTRCFPGYPHWAATERNRAARLETIYAIIKCAVAVSA